MQRNELSKNLTHSFMQKKINLHGETLVNGKISTILFFLKKQQQKS